MFDHVLQESGARAIIFDMDGTLVDNMGHHRLAWIEWAHAEGLRLGESELMAQTHGTIREIVQRLFPSDSEAERHARGVRKEETYRRIYAPHLRLIAGLDEFLQQAHERQTPLAVATAGDWVNIEFTLDGLGIRHLFPVIIGGEDVRHGKPHPEVFLTAAEKLGYAPEDCLVFEDSPAGVEAARRANMKRIVVNPMTPLEAFGETDHVLHFARDYFDLELQTAAVSNK